MDFLSSLFKSDIGFYRIAGKDILFFGRINTNRNAVIDSFFRAAAESLPAALPVIC